MLKQIEYPHCNCHLNIMLRLDSLIDLRIEIDRALEAAQFISSIDNFNEYCSCCASREILHSNIKRLYDQLVIINKMVTE